MEGLELTEDSRSHRIVTHYPCESLGGFGAVSSYFVLSQVGGEVILSNLSTTARNQVHLRKEGHRVPPKKEQAAML